MRRCCALMLAALWCVSAAETHYGLVFDAGSSGSRIHIYSWRTGGGGPKDGFDLIADELHKIKPGLSSHKANPAGAGASLRPLLDYAKATVPESMRATTPVFLMATAGLRMVGEAAKDAILASVCVELEASGFLFKCEWATMMSGLDEGLYGWVTVNYLLDTLYPPVGEKPAEEQPAGIIDLGGGSVQIVFPTEARAPEGYTKAMSFGGRPHTVYIKSHLGFGLDAAREAVLDHIVAKGQGAASLKHPCLPVGSEVVHKQVKLIGESNWNRCERITSKLFNKTSRCEYTSCSFNGEYQPALPRSFMGFSYMYDRTAAIGLLDGTPTPYGSQKMSRAQIEDKGREVCALDAAATAARFAATQDAAKSHLYCGDVAYVAALLGALGFERGDTLTMTNKIKNVELVWTLGAIIGKSAELALKGMGAGAGLLSLLLAICTIGVVIKLIRKLIPAGRQGTMLGSPRGNKFGARR